MAPTERRDVTLYHLYGLAVESEFECPELTPVTPEQAATRGLARVEVRRARAPLALPGARREMPWMAVTPDSCLYEFDGIARMLVERPDRITVELAPGADTGDMRAYLFGHGFGTLVQMRGLIPLHIAAILTPEGVVAFTGPSGAGKSTRVAELHLRHGWPIICDDVAVLHPTDPEPLLHAGMNRIKLWRDALDRLGIAPEGLIRDLTREDKFHLIAPGMFVQHTLPLTRLVTLGTEDQAQTRGAAAFAALMNAVYKPELGALFGPRGGHFQQLAQLAERLGRSGGEALTQTRSTSGTG